MLLVNNKLFKLIFIIILIVPILLIYAQGNSGTVNFEKILNCKDQGFNHCNLVLSPIYKYPGSNSNFGNFGYTFPPDGPYSEAIVDCGNKNDVTLAEYNGETWIPIQSRLFGEGDNKFVNITTNRLGTFALIRTEACVVQCGDGSGAYSLSPFNANVRAGRNLIFNLCGMLPGCQALEDGVCSNSCTQNIDPDCGECTNNGGDCCLLSKDDVCDSDCGDFDPDCTTLAKGDRNSCFNSCDGVCDSSCAYGTDPDCIDLPSNVQGQKVQCAYCGDEKCNQNEALTRSCEEDCGVCGDETCNQWETFESQFSSTHVYCPEDCLDDGEDKGDEVSCFLYGTEILMSGGDTKNIEEIEIGDIVNGFDQSSKKIIDTRVTSILKEHPRNFYYILNEEIKVTNDHPFAVIEDNEINWIEVKNLGIGDKIRSLDGYVIIHSLEKIEEKAVTVTLETEAGNFFVKDEDHNYLVKEGDGQGLIGEFEYCKDEECNIIIKEVRK